MGQIWKILWLCTSGLDIEARFFFIDFLNNIWKTQILQFFLIRKSNEVKGNVNVAKLSLI